MSNLMSPALSRRDNGSPVMTCSNCGHHEPATSDRCANCGAPLGRGTAETAANPQVGIGRDQQPTEYSGTRAAATAASGSFDGEAGTVASTLALDAPTIEAGPSRGVPTAVTGPLAPGQDF